jgi:RNA polymerase sigma-70 factor (ECF subfamily)
VLIDLGERGRWQAPAYQSKNGLVAQARQRSPFSIVASRWERSQNGSATMSGLSLYDALRTVLPVPHSRDRDAGLLEALLREHVEAARAAWPTVEVDPIGFVRHLASRLPKELTIEQALAAVDEKDLYLAYACLSGNRAALSALDREILSKVGGYIAKIDSSPVFADEVRQELRHKLLADGDGAASKMAAYDGRGPLAAWVRVVAVRAARNLLRGTRQHLPLESEGALDLLSRAPDPELAFLKERYGPQFKRAFQQALKSLPAKERNLLALYYVEGLKSTAIGAMYGVQAVTVRAWLKATRETLLANTHAALSSKLGLTPSELESVIALVRSQIDLTISRALQGPDGTR